MNFKKVLLVLAPFASAAAEAAVETLVGSGDVLNRTILMHALAAAVLADLALVKLMLNPKAPS